MFSVFHSKRTSGGQQIDKIIPAKRRREEDEDLQDLQANVKRQRRMCSDMIERITRAKRAREADRYKESDSEEEMPSSKRGKQ